jgi:hypothetical protein
LCKDGLCECTADWSGPACDGIFSRSPLPFISFLSLVGKSPFKVNYNHTNPSFEISPNSSSAVLFVISLVKIYELNYRTAVVSSFNMSDYSFTLVQTNFSGNAVWEYSVQLANKATINATVSLQERNETGR